MLQPSTFPMLARTKHTNLDPRRSNPSHQILPRSRLIQPFVGDQLLDMIQRNQPTQNTDPSFCFSRQQPITILTQILTDPSISKPYSQILMIQSIVIYIIAHLDPKWSSHQQNPINQKLTGIEINRSSLSQWQLSSNRNKGIAAQAIQ